MTAKIKRPVPANSVEVSVRFTARLSDGRALNNYGWVVKIWINIKTETDVGKLKFQHVQIKKKALSPQ